MKVGIPRESAEGERRVAASPDTVKAMRDFGLEVQIEHSAGEASGFHDYAYKAAGAHMISREDAFKAAIVLKVQVPSTEEIKLMQSEATLIATWTICGESLPTAALMRAGIHGFNLQNLPRTSRAQPMDALSSQANISGYRAVIEAVYQYERFFPLMMTAAGSSKPARVIILGAGVAGLQAIATAKRLGAQVEAYDVRPEVKEQIESLGAKFIDLNIQESGEGEGGYAKELSDDAKKQEQERLTEYLKKADIIITTAAIPCQPAPILITAEAVEGMREGSVIVDLAAPTGGNCELTEPGKVVERHHVRIVGSLNLPSAIAGDASLFYSKNIWGLLQLIVQKDEHGCLSFTDPQADELTSASLVTAT